MFHKDKENCFAEKAITNNHRKTFAKLVKTIAAKALVFCSFTKQSLILSYTYFCTLPLKLTISKDQVLQDKSFYDDRLIS